MRAHRGLRAWAYDLAKDEWRDLNPAVQPPTKQNDPVLAYDAAHQVVVALVRVVDKRQGDQLLGGHLETWAYDAGKNTWTAMKPPREPDGWASRRRVLTAVPDQQLLLMEAYANPSDRMPGVDREQQIWTYRYGPVQPARVPQPPTGLTVATREGRRAVLSWQPVPEAWMYRIYQGGVDVLPWHVDLKPVATVESPATTWTDFGPIRPGVHYYAVRAVTKDGRESDQSITVPTQPRIVEDAVVSVLSVSKIHLAWKPPPQEDIAITSIADVQVFSDDEILRLKKDTPPLPEPSVGAVRAIGPFQRLNLELIKGTAYTDTGIEPDQERRRSGSRRRSRTGFAPISSTPRASRTVSPCMRIAFVRSMPWAWRAVHRPTFSRFRPRPPGCSRAKRDAIAS